MLVAHWPLNDGGSEVIWTGSVGSGTYTVATVNVTINKPIKEDKYIGFKLHDAEGAVRLYWNGHYLGKPSGADNETKVYWYWVPKGALIEGENEVMFSSNWDATTLTEITMVSGLADISGNGYHLENYGATVNNNGKIGKCYQFLQNGTDHMKLMSPYGLGNMGDNGTRTFALWVHGDGIGATKKLLGNRDPSNSRDWFQIQFSGEHNKLNVELADDYGDGGTLCYTPYTTTRTPGWNHYVVIIDNTGELTNVKTYVNSTLESNFNAPSKLNMDSGYDNIEIGTWGNNLASQIRGRVNDVRIYDHALSDKEIKELSKAKILHYDFNESKESTKNLITNQDMLSWSKSDSVTPTLTNETYKGMPVYKVVYSGSANNRIYLNDIGKFSGNVTHSVYYKRGLDGDEGGHCALYIRGSNFGSTHGGATLGNMDRQWHRESITADLATEENLMFLLYKSSSHIVENIVIYFCMPQSETKAYCTDFVDGERVDIVKDVSGFGNDAKLELATTPRWTSDSRLGSGAYEFKKDGRTGVLGDVMQKVSTNLSHYKAQQFTISLWYRHDTLSHDWRHPIITYCKKTEQHGASQGSMNICIQNNYPMVHLWGGKDVGASSNRTDDGLYHNFVVRIDHTNRLLSISLDGVHVAKDFNYDDSYDMASSVNSDIWEWQIGHFASGYDWGGVETPTNSGYQKTFQGDIDDPRIYATLLSDDDIKELYQSRANLDDHGNLLVNHVGQKENLIHDINRAVEDKEWKDGLSNYQQAHCKCTLTNDGYRVYRTPNLTQSGNGNVMWGGILLFMPEGTFVDGRKYVFKCKYKGVSSDGIREIFFAYECGWSGWGSLGVADVVDSISMESDRQQQIDTNGEWEDMIIHISPTQDQMYKAAVNSGHPSDHSVDGIVHYKMRHFKIGHAYGSTGALGTDLCYKDFRLYDITDGEEKEVKITDKGEVIADYMSEVGTTKGLIGYWKWDGKNRDLGGYATTIPTLSGTAEIHPEWLEVKAVANETSLVSYNDIASKIMLKGSEDTESYTISVLACPNSTTQKEEAMVFAKTGNHTGLVIQGNKWRFRFPNDGGFYALDSLNTISTEWTSIICTYDKRVAKIYINGNLEKTMTVGGTYRYTGNTFNTGHVGTAGGNYQYDGKIREVKAFERALTEDEIKMEYKLAMEVSNMEITRDTLYTKNIKEGY